MGFCLGLNDFLNTRLIIIFFTSPPSQGLPSPPRATPHCLARPPPPPPSTANRALRRSSTTLTSSWTSRVAWPPRPPPPQVRLRHQSAAERWDAGLPVSQAPTQEFKNSCEAFAAHLRKNNLCCCYFGGFVLLYLLARRFPGFCLQM